MDIREFIDTFINTDNGEYFPSPNDRADVAAFLSRIFGRKGKAGIKMLYTQAFLNQEITLKLTEYWPYVQWFTHLNDTYTLMYNNADWGDKVDFTNTINTNLTNILNFTKGNQQLTSAITTGKHNILTNFGNQSHSEILGGDTTTNNMEYGIANTINKSGELITKYGDNSDNTILKYEGMDAIGIGTTYKSLNKDINQLATENLTTREAQAVGDATTNEAHKDINTNTYSGKTNTDTTAARVDQSDYSQRDDQSTISEGVRNDVSSTTLKDSKINTSSGILRTNILENYTKLLQMIISPKMVQFKNEFINEYAQLWYVINDLK